MKMRSKIILGLAAVLVAVLVFAAAPPPGTYTVPSFFTTNAAKIYGTNGVGVSSNAVTGIYLIDGKNLTNGLTGGTNAVIQTNGVNVGQVGTLNFVDANNTTVTGVLAGGVAKIGVNSTSSGGGGSNFLFNPNQFASPAGGTNISLKTSPFITNGAGYGAWSFDFFSTPGNIQVLNDGADGTFVIGDIGSGIMAGFHGRPSEPTNGFRPDGSGFFGAGRTQIDPRGLIKTVAVTVTNGITNLSLTALTVIASDANKKEVSIPNGTGALTNNGSGGVGWFNGFGTGSGGGSNYLFDVTQFASDAGGTNIAIKDGVLLTNPVVKQTLTGDAWNIDGAGNATLGADILLQQGGDSNFREGINWDNGNSALKNDGRIFLRNAMHTASRLLRMDAGNNTTNSVYDDDDIAKRQIGDAKLTNFSALANSAGFLKNDGSGTYSWQDRPLVDPFVVIDNVAYYPTNPWNQKLSEEWNGDVTSTTLGAMGNNSWAITSSGNTVFRVAQLAESTADGYLSIVLTNAGTATTYLIGNSSTPSYLLATNKSLIWFSRIRVGLTNVTGQIQKMIVGLGNSTTFNEPTDGIYLTVNTNLNTNSFVAVTARGASRTFTYSQHPSNTFNQFEWVVVGARLDQTGTNAIFFCGPSRTNLTSFATNSATIPDTVLVAPIVTVHRITGTGAATRLTNYCDNYFLWQLPKTANF